MGGGDQGLGDHVVAVLGDFAGGFQRLQTAQGAAVNFVTGTLVAGAGEVLLQGLAHLQQYRFHIDLVVRSQCGLGKLHHHQRITVGVIFYRPLALAIVIGGRWHGLHLPVAGPGNRQTFGIRRRQRKGGEKSDECGVTVRKSHGRQAFRAVSWQA